MSTSLSRLIAKKNLFEKVRGLKAGAGAFRKGEGSELKRNLVNLSIEVDSIIILIKSYLNQIWFSIKS